MMSFSSRRAIGLVLILGAATCDKPPSPVSPGPTPTATPAAGSPSLLAIAVTGPTRMAPGTAAQFTATGQYSDGSTADVTAQASWGPTNATNAVVYFTAGGLAHSGVRGEVRVAASLGGKHSDSLTILVLDPGTYRVSGTVNEANGRPLPGALVEITSGTGVGLRTTSNYDGHYALYGAAGTIQLRVSVAGMSTQLQQADIADDTTKDFGLTPEVSPSDVSGDWVLTLSASPSCRAALPEIARDRQYAVHIVQRGTGLSVAISAPTLQVWNPGEDTGTVLDHHVSFVFVGDTDYGGWSSVDLVDHLTATQSLGFDGLVDGTASDNGIQATMSGDLEYWDSTAPQPGLGGPNAVCRATDHVVTLRRGTLGARAIRRAEARRLEHALPRLFAHLPDTP